MIQLLALYSNLAGKKCLTIIGTEGDDFTEIHFSRLVREARIGENMAKSYLDLLLRKGYIEIRDDGYRKFYRIKTPSAIG